MKRTYRLKQGESKDIIRFLPDWNEKFFFNALTEDWPLNKVISTNWAYSENSRYLVQASRQKQRGCNILALINCRSTESARANRISALISRRRVYGSIKFDGWKTGNGDSYSVLEFLQPEMYDRM